MSDMSAPNRTSRARFLPLIIIAVVAATGALFLRDHLSFQTLADNRDALLALRDQHFFATVVTFVSIYTVIVAFSLPGATAMTLAGGFLFATFPGTFINMTGATLGAVGIFFAVRWGFGELLAARMDASDGMVKKIKSGIDANQWSMLFLIRLVPAVPFFVANIVPALVGVPAMRFAVSTFLGIIPAAIVYTSIGAGLGEVFDRGEAPNLGIVFEPHILLPILGLCALAALPIFLKAFRGRKGL